MNETNIGEKQKDKDARKMEPESTGEMQGMICEESFGWVSRQRSYTLEDYYALPDERRVELIDGVFYDMASPSTVYQYFITELTVCIRNFIGDRKGGCLVFPAPLDVQLDCDEYTMVEPDVIVICNRDIMKKSHIFGAPDFLMEIMSPSTRNKDSSLKLKKYRAAGVREYWIIDPDKERVVTYFFEEGDIPKIYGSDKEVPVRIFGGSLMIPFPELFKRMRESGLV